MLTLLNVNPIHKHILHGLMTFVSLGWVSDSPAHQLAPGNEWAEEEDFVSILAANNFSPLTYRSLVSVVRRSMNG